MQPCHAEDGVKISILWGKSAYSHNKPQKNWKKQIKTVNLQRFIDYS